MKPISESGKTFIKNTYALKEMIKNVNLDEDFLIAFLNIVGLYLLFLLKKALEVMCEVLEVDETFALQNRLEI